MDRLKMRAKEVIELFDEKTGKVVRIIRFHNSTSFEEFLIGFNAMRYPGYNWRYKDKCKTYQKH